MAGSKNLKLKLKAANRRRAKRAKAAGRTDSAEQTTSSSPTSPTAASNRQRGIDVVGKLCQVLLEDADLAENPRDQTAIRSLRRCLKTQEEEPGPCESEDLVSRLRGVEQEEGVSHRSYRDAVGDLLELAQQHQTTTSPNSFLRYLSILTS